MTDTLAPDTVFLQDPPLPPAALLRWYVDAGVDLAVAETPHNRLAEPPPPQPTAQPQTTPAVPVAAKAVSPPTLRLKTDDINDLSALKVRVDGFDGCTLRRTATQTVFGDGPANARLMVIGEAPGADEDRTGVPFVGRAGQLLNKMLTSIGWPRGAVYITNVVPWRPPGNRNPTTEEISLCRPFVMRSIELIAPDAILLLGGSAASAILESVTGITRLRGKWHDLTLSNGTTIPAIATFHPAFLLRFPDKKGLVWRDLLTLQSRIGQPQPTADSDKQYTRLAPEGDSG